MDLNTNKLLTGESFEAKKLVSAIVSKIWLLALVPLVVFSIIYLYLRYVPNIYEGQAILLLEVKENPVLGTINKSTQEDASGEIELLKSRDNIQRVVDSLKLQIKYFEEGRIISIPKYKNIPFDITFNDNTFTAYDRQIDLRFTSPTDYELFDKPTARLLGKGKTGQPFLLDSLSSITVNTTAELRASDIQRDFFFVIVDKDQAINEVSKSLRVSPLPGQSLFELRYQDEVPNRMQEVLNLTMAFYLQNELAFKLKTYDQTIGFIDTLLLGMSSKMDSTERRLKIYESQFDIPTFSARQSEQLSLFVAYRSELAQIEQNKVGLRLLEDYLNNKLGGKSQLTGDVLFAPRLESLNDELINTSINLLNEEIINFKNLSERLTPNSNPVIQSQNRIMLLKSQVAESLKNARTNLDLKERFLREKLSEVKLNVMDFPSQSRGLEIVSKDYSLNQSFFDMLAKTRVEKLIAKSAVVSQSRIVQAAYINKVPVSPQRKKMLLGGAVMALFVTLAFVIVRQALDNTLLYYRELEAVAPCPVVGEIPRNKAQTSEHASLHVINTPNSLSTEAFRRLRASVLFLLADKPHKRIAVTSTISQEGKSYVSTNFAGILSMMDKKVVIIDTDLRKPRLHFAFGLNNDVGVSTYLIGRNDIDDIIQHTESANLDVVTTGLKPPNPAELLATPRFEQLLLELEERYDYVVIDTSPIGMVTDAIAVLNKVPVCLYMFRAKYSKKHFLNNVEYLMKKNELNNIYMVFNATEYRGVFGKQYSSSFVYGDGYGYGYGYGYVYGGGGPKSNRKGFGYFEEVEETKRPWWQFWKKNQQAD